MVLHPLPVHRAPSRHTWHPPPPPCRKSSLDGDWGWERGEEGWWEAGFWATS